MAYFFKKLFRRNKLCDVFKVAQIFCQLSQWKLTSAELQKILYIAQVFSLGLRARPLFKNKISAWRYGPVVDDLYKEVKYYGSKVIDPITFVYHSEYECSKEDLEFINMIYFLTKDLKDWQLVGLVHQPGTAWRNSVSDHGLFSEIPFSYMLDEFKNVYESRLDKNKEKKLVI